MNLFYIVRKVSTPKLAVQRKLKTKRKQNTNQQCVIAHNSYRNPFGKVEFHTSESAMTDTAFVERRRMVNDFKFTFI